MKCRLFAPLAHPDEQQTADPEKGAVELGGSSRVLEEMLSKRAAGGEPGAEDAAADGAAGKKQKTSKAGRADGPGESTNPCVGWRWW